MLETTKNKVQYQADGIRKIWPFDFKVFRPSDLDIYITDPNGGEVLQTQHYCVDLLNNTVEYPIDESALPPLKEGYKITILRNTPLVQDFGPERNGDFDAEIIEATLDKIVACMQDFDEKVNRCIIFPASQLVTENDTKGFLQQILNAQGAAAESQSAAAQSARQAWLAAGKIVKHIEAYTAGMAEGNYTGSLTDFKLVKEYQPNSKSITVALNGVIKECDREYIEVDSQTIRFNFSVPNGARVLILWGVNLDMPNNEAPGLESVKADIEALTKEITALKNQLDVKLTASDLIAGENITIEPFLEEENNTTEGV